MSESSLTKLRQAIAKYGVENFRYGDHDTAVLDELTLAGEAVKMELAAVEQELAELRVRPTQQTVLDAIALVLIRCNRFVGEPVQQMLRDAVRGCYSKIG